MKPIRPVAAGAALVAVGALLATAVWTGGAPEARGATTVDPTDFTNPAANAYFPLVPGTVSHYRGSEDGEQFRERLAVTHLTKVIQGVTTTVIHDVLRRSNGTLAEKTTDWYAADNAGNVWYFGEKTATYDDSGKLESREGSWRAGVDGAVVGLIMPADPGPTDSYRQEYYKRHAEDQGWIVSRNVRLTVPYGKLRHVLRTFEWTRLEPNVMAVKFYGKGLGIVRERDLKGGNERLDLVSVTHH